RSLRDTCRERGQAGDAVLEIRVGTVDHGEDEHAGLAGRDADGAYATELAERTLERRDAGDARQPVDEQAGVGDARRLEVVALGMERPPCGRQHRGRPDLV